MARSLALGHWGISSSFRKLSAAGDYIPCSAYKDIEKAAEKVNSITSGDGGGEEEGGRGGEERQMKFKLATSPATNLKQCSERKPKRKEKQRGVCVETHSVCARERQRAREAKREQRKEGMRLQAEVSGAISGGPSQSRKACRGRFWGHSHHP